MHCDQCEELKANNFEYYTNKWGIKVNGPFGDFPSNSSFDIADLPSLNSPGWAIDSGLPFGQHSQRSGYQGPANLEYGWNCDVTEDATIGLAPQYLNADNVMNETWIGYMDLACPGKDPAEPKIWSLRLPEGPGLYRVYVYAGRPQRFPSIFPRKRRA